MPDEELQRRVRLFIFERFRDQAIPPVVEQVMTEFSLSREEAVDALRALEEAHHIALVRGTARILMAFPFSAVATPFRITAAGRHYFANCSWDAIAFHAMLGQDTRVDSYCQHCAEPIAVEMSGGRATRVEPAATLVYLARRPTQWWEDITTTCSNTMVFFAGPDHRDASDLSVSADGAASLTLDQVHALGAPIYAGKFALDYVRPTRDQMLAHYAALGLTGDYWTS